jgi:hypothetical protein
MSALGRVHRTVALHLVHDDRSHTCISANDPERH